ncbi:hypothetical protein LVD15_16135 [Fulvivirga maritima]|uniref:cytidylyltransferase domain-containing protein n=1 Tax=Fulvivirga maritima TaxID=2904247 RepID=UPI001F361B87|nr:hypothetical protein [Fulvivirga maritima]UII24832.1 hypothetical protein LVD15_16135 [Fulvivirga maritima]
MNKVGAVVLSRFNSSRLPGKALMSIKEKPILLYIYERLRQVLPPEQIIIATSAEASDDPIAEFCLSNNIQCYRGALHNVAERFYEAGERLKCDYFIRINGDNIFLDIKLLAKIYKLSEEAKHDFISNVKGRTFPKGMSIEVVKRDYYRGILPEINKDDTYKEHVTLLLYEKKDDDHFFIYNESNTEMAGIQLALDTVEDFKRTEKIIYQFSKDHREYGMEEINEILKEIE